MKRHLLYLKYVLRHKWFVFLACLELRVPIWNAIFHDWSKFLPVEWFAYVNYFYGEKVQDENGFQTLKDGKLTPIMVAPIEVRRAFDRAWNAHQKRNKHHWQFWLLTPDKPRPNFSIQSMDGGMTHATVSTVNTGEIAAVLYHDAISWLKANSGLERQLKADLYNTPVALQMPDVYIREMVADWRGAGRAQGNPDTKAWYLANRDNMTLHPITRMDVEVYLGLSAAERSKS